MKNLKPGRFVKFKSYIVRCSKGCDDIDICEICRKEWKDLNCVPPCRPYNPNATCLDTFECDRYPRPIKGQDYSLLKLLKP